jgi:hypothetical protein
MKKSKNWLLIIVVVIVAIWVLPAALGALGSLVCVSFSLIGSLISVGFWALVVWLLWKLWKKA